MKKILTTVAAVAVSSSAAFAADTVGGKLNTALTKAYGAIAAFDPSYLTSGSAMVDVDSDAAELNRLVSNYGTSIQVTQPSTWEFNWETYTLEEVAGETTTTDYNGINTADITAQAGKLSDTVKVAIYGRGSGTSDLDGLAEAVTGYAAEKLVTAVVDDTKAFNDAIDSWQNNGGTLQAITDAATDLQTSGSNLGTAASTAQTDLTDNVDSINDSTEWGTGGEYQDVVSFTPSHYHPES